MTPGERIRQLRRARGVTTPQLAEMCGVPAPTIYMWEKDRIVPTSAELAAAMRALGVTDEVQDAPPHDEATLEPAPDAVPRASERVSASQTIHLPPRISLAPPPSVVKDAGANASANEGGAFDIAAITKAYNVVRDFADGADVIELSTARALLHESLKIVKARLRQLTDDDPEDMA